MSRVRRHLDSTLGALLAFLVAAAVANVVWQVFTRFVLRAPSSFTDEAARYLLVWLGLVGAAYASGHRLHVAVDLLPRDLPPRLRALLDAAAQLLILVFSLGVMVGGGLRLVWLSYELGQRSAALGLPLGVVYLALPVSGAAIALHSLLSLYALGRTAAPGTEEPLP